MARKQARTVAHGTIETYRRPSSQNGNPSFEVVFRPFDSTQEGVVGRTRPNAQFCYSMPRDGVATVEYHETAAGRVVFDDVRRLGGAL